MAKMIFDATTGTVLTIHEEVYVVDMGEFAEEMSVDPDYAKDMLVDGDEGYRTVAEFMGATLPNILKLANITN